MKSLCAVAVLAATAICGSKLSAAETGSTAEPEKTYYIVYHDDYRNIIRRDPYKADYTFNAMDPFFWVALPVSNTAWCTVYTEMGSTPEDGATVYKTGDKLTNALTEDLHLYPITSYGTFVRFDSDGGAPFHYQFIHVGKHATNPGSPTKTGYTFGGWYQVLMDEEGHETGLATTQFDFSNWTPVKTETVTPPKEIVIRAKWTPVTVNYSVHIWLEKAEHSNRTDAADALAHFLDDYSYGGTITKTGKSDENVSFNPASESTPNKNYINSLIQYKPTGSGLTYTKYYYDNEDGSLAKAMSEAEIAAINAAGGIHADGSTTVNVFYRRMRYHLNIGYSENFRYQGDIPTVSNVQCAVDCPIRFEETIKSALARHDKTVSNPLGNLMDENTFTSNAHWALTYMQGWIWGFEDEYPEGGMNAFIFPKPEDIYNDMNTPAGFSDGVNVYTYFVNYNITGYKYVRQIYLQNLDEDMTISDGDLNTLSKFTKHSQQNWIEDTGGYDSEFFPYQYEGFTMYKRQIVKDNNRKEYWNNSIGKPVAYSTDTNKYPYYSKSDGNDLQNWQVELFYSRNHHSVSFETFTNKITVTHSNKFDNVYYQQPLSEISSDIKHDGQPFVVGTTYYEDDQNARYIFKGWYDNAAYEGNPVDFSTYLMPDHNVMLYAKWEKQLIDITFDADGGKIQGGGTYVMQIASGQIPYLNDEPVSPDPGRLEFFSWTYEGAYYEFLEPFYEDATLVALYYADPARPLKITYEAGEGTGNDVTEFADYGYLYNANAGYQPYEYEEYFGDWTLPKGKIFKYWYDNSNKKTYNPYTDPDGEIIMKNDITLTAIYEDGHADIIIERNGLLEGESAVYAVYKVDETTSAKTLVMRIPLTQTASTPSGSTPAKVSRKIVNMEPGRYTVEETVWSWAYAKGDTEVTPKSGTMAKKVSSGKGTGTGDLVYESSLTFTFGGAADSEVLKHDEDVQNNNFTGISSN